MKSLKKELFQSPPRDCVVIAGKGGEAGQNEGDEDIPLHLFPGRIMLLALYRK